MTTYKELDAKLTGRNSERRKLGNNTYALRDNDPDKAIAIRLHATDILRFYPDGRVILNTGGWRTVTTKDRLNTYLPAGWRVYSERGAWYMYKGGKIVAPYGDGLTIKGARIVGGAPHGGAAIKAAAQANKALRAIVAGYAVGFLTALDNGDVPLPGPGDCFYCAMREEKTGLPLGEATRNADHIREHIKEEYYVPSLLVRALETFGASQVTRWYVHGKMTGQEETAGLGMYAREQAEKMLRRYVLRQLGGAA